MVILGIWYDVAGAARSSEAGPEPLAKKARTLGLRALATLLAMAL